MAATGHHLEDVIALLRQRNTSTLCRPLEACESLNTQDKAERSAWSSALYRTLDQIVDASIPQPQEESLENLCSSRSAEKYVYIVLVF